MSLEDILCELNDKVFSKDALILLNSLELINFFNGFTPTWTEKVVALKT